MRVLFPLLGACGVSLAYQGLTGWQPLALRRAGRLRVLVESSGLAWLSPVRLVGLTVGTGSVVFVIVSGLTGSLPVATATALMAASTPLSWVRATGRRRLARFREEWPDAIATLIAGIRSGRSLGESCIGVSKRCGEGLRPGFQAFARTYRASGNLSAALGELRAVMADPIADRVAIALRCAHEVGGTDLVRVLRALGDFVRSDLQARREVEARWSWTTTAAKLAAAAPWVVLLIMSLRPEAAAAYSSNGGVILLTVGALATILGYRLMLRAARLPAERRLQG